MEQWLLTLPVWECMAAAISDAVQATTNAAAPLYFATDDGRLVSAISAKLSKCVVHPSRVAVLPLPQLSTPPLLGTARPWAS